MSRETKQPRDNRFIVDHRSASVSGKGTGKPIDISAYFKEKSMKANDELLGSITQNDNPEGINQYTSARAAAEKATSHANLMTGMAQAANGAPHQAKAEAKAIQAHRDAAEAHKVAAAEVRKLPMNNANRQSYNYHLNMAGNHAGTRGNPSPFRGK